MEPNFVRVKVSELKNYFQVRGICAANKRREELLDWSVKALELAIEIIDEQGDQLRRIPLKVRAISAKINY